MNRRVALVAIVTALVALCAAPLARGAWVAEDIRPRGSTSGSLPGPLTIQGYGSDIWGSADTFHFYHGQQAGDFTVTARIVSQQATASGAKAGLMARASTAAGAIHAMVVTTPGTGIQFQWRDAAGGPSGGVQLSTSTAKPVWLKLIRSGQTFTAQWAADVGGAPGTWNTSAPHTSPGMPVTAEAGLCVCSQNGMSLCQVTAANVQFSGGAPAMVAEDVGFAAGSTTGTLPGPVTVAGAGFGISGPVDSFHYYHDAWGGDFTAVARLNSQTPTAPWAKAGIMAREGTAPGARNVLLAATPGNGVALQWRDIPNSPSAPWTRIPGSPNSTTAPFWLLLGRSGSIFWGAWAPDSGGAPGTWSTPQVHLAPAMPATVELGLAVSNYVQPSALNTAVFQGVLIQPTSSPPAPRVWYVDRANLGDPLQDGSEEHPFDAIQKGINAAMDRDTVQVAAGTYPERLSWAWKSLTLVAPAGAATTIVNAASAAGIPRCLTMDFVPSTARVEGFTFTGASNTYPGGGVYLVQSSPTLAANIITGNTAAIGGGLYMLYSSATLSGNTISGNTATSTGGGGLFAASSSPLLDGNTISNNTATNSGGGLFFTASSGTLGGNTISNNRSTSRNGGGVYLDANSSPTVTCNTITTNSAGASGGGLYIWNSSPSLATNTVTGNTANLGGGLFLVSSSPKLTGNTICGNTASSAGGGLFLASSSPLLDANSVADNTATFEGGGLMMTASSPTLTGNTIERNRALNISGGGVAILNPSSPTLTGNTISDNAAPRGGGINVYQASPRLTDNTVSGNTASGSLGGGGLCFLGSSGTLDWNTISGNNSPSGRGGGIYLDSNSAPALTNNSLTGNSASYSGGGLYASSSSPTLTTNTIADNTANDGGGLYLNSSSVAIKNGNVISGNRASADGGGLFAAGGSVTLDANTVENNESQGAGGGGCLFTYASATLTNNVVRNNSAYDGGGILLTNGSSGLVSGNTITGNSAGRAGGGLILNSSLVTLTNNVIAGNSASLEGGGVNVSSASPTLTNNTIALNAPGGLRASASNPLITNCILWGNTGADDLAGASATYSDIGTGNTAGLGNICVDPLFAGPDDYHLQAPSLCINRGSNAAPALPATDKDGNPRIVGLRVDMGAYESPVVNRPPIANAGPDQTLEQTSAAGAPVTLDGSASFDPDGDPISFTWTEGGVEIATGVSPTVTLPLGTHQVVLTVTDEPGASSTDTVEITVQDTTPPQVLCWAERSALWPPEHEMVNIGFWFAVLDICDVAPDVAVTVTSDEATAEELGAGGSEYSPDAFVTWHADGTCTVELRAERSGTADGRVYVVTVTATDASGNVASASWTVAVPLDQSQSGAAVDSGQRYDATEVN